MNNRFLKWLSYRRHRRVVRNSREGLQSYVVNRLAASRENENENVVVPGCKSLICGKCASEYVEEMTQNGTYFGGTPREITQGLANRRMKIVETSYFGVAASFIFVVCVVIAAVVWICTRN